MEPTTRTVHELAPDAGSNAVSTAVVRAVAQCRGLETTELDACLYDVVEVDALERLFRYGNDDGSGVTGSVGFSLAGCDVCVRSDGRITVAQEEAGTLAFPVPTTDDALNSTADRGAGVDNDLHFVETTSDAQPNVRLSGSD